MKETVLNVRFIRFFVPTVPDEKGKVKNLKFFHAQVTKPSVFSEKWKYVLENMDGHTFPKPFTTKKEGIEFIKAQTGLREDLITVFVHPTINKV